jgi:hypothetical protein
MPIVAMTVLIPLLDPGAPNQHMVDLKPDIVLAWPQGPKQKGSQCRVLPTSQEAEVLKILEDEQVVPGAAY